MKVINLSDAPGHRERWDRPIPVILLWPIVEWLLVTNALQPSSRIRVLALRLFGATVGADVIIRPRVRVKFPWNLKIGDRSWVGEGVWIHNQDDVVIGEDVVISQETFITTGSHAAAIDMALRTMPIRIDSGAWVTSRCIITAGSHIGTSALVVPMTVVRGRVPDGCRFGNDDARSLGERFKTQ